MFRIETFETHGDLGILHFFEIPTVMAIYEL